MPRAKRKRCCFRSFYQRFLRRRIPERPNGDFTQVYRVHVVAFPMSCGAGKGEQHVFLRQKRRRLRGAYIVAHKEDGFCPACPQSVQNGLDLRIPHGNKDHIIGVRRIQFRLTDMHGENRFLIFSPLVLISFAQFPRASKVTSFPARNRFLARLQPRTPAPKTKIFIVLPL